MNNKNSEVVAAARIKFETWIDSDVNQKRSSSIMLSSRYEEIVRYLKVTLRFFHPSARFFIFRNLSTHPLIPNHHLLDTSE